MSELPFLPTAALCPFKSLRNPRKKLEPGLFRSMIDRSLTDPLNRNNKTQKGDWQWYLSHPCRLQNSDWFFPPTLTEIYRMSLQGSSNFGSYFPSQRRPDRSKGYLTYQILFFTLYMLVLFSSLIRIMRD